MRKRIYIAGPMRGVEKYNFPLFFEVEAELAGCGWEVVSPARMDVLIDGLDPEDPKPNEDVGIDYYMARDLPAVRSCKAIAMLPPSKEGRRWQDSTGANRELAEAIKHGKTVYVVERINVECIGGGKHERFLLVKAPEIQPDPAKLAPEGGFNLNAGKLRVDLVPASAIEAVAEVLGRNCQPAGKYPPRNWEKGTSWMENYASLMRHLLAWLRGEDIDPDSGLPHSHGFLTRAAFLVEYERTGAGIDDRPGKAAA